MRAIVDAKEFSQALNKVNKVLKQSAIPILEGVLVQIKDNICTLTATDFTTWLTTSVPATGDDLGFVFQRPKDAAKACAYFEGELTLDTVEKSAEQDHCMKLAMLCGPRAAQVMAYLPEDYPSMPEHQAKHTYRVNAARLLERLEHVKYTLMKPDPATRAQSTHVQFSGNKVYALDGNRLAWDMDDALCVQQPFMVLPEALVHLKMFGNQEVTASMGERYLRITDEKTVIQTRIEGPFVFNVDGAIPKNFSEEFYIFPKDFLRELDYLKKLAHNAGKVSVYFSKGRLSMIAAGGRYDTQVQIDGTSEIDFGFELRYMIDALRQFQGEPAVKMKVINSMAPIVLETEGRSDFAMVLPVRMNIAAA